MAAAGGGAACALEYFEGSGQRVLLSEVHGNRSFAVCNPAFAGAVEKPEQ